MQWQDTEAYCLCERQRFASIEKCSDPLHINCLPSLITNDSLRRVRKFQMTLTHSHSRVPLEVSSATFILLEITWELSESLRNISRRVVLYLLVNISPSNVFDKMLW